LLLVTVTKKVVVTGNSNKKKLLLLVTVTKKVIVTDN